MRVCTFRCIIPLGRRMRRLVNIQGSNKFLRFDKNGEGVVLFVRTMPGPNKYRRQFERTNMLARSYIYGEKYGRWPNIRTVRGGVLGPFAFRTTESTRQLRKQRRI